MGFAIIKFVVESFGEINGWNYGQLAFLYGLSVISHALSMIDLIPGILVFIYGCVKCEVTVNLLFILQVVVILVGAMLIRGGIYILLGSTSFHTRSAVDFGQYTQEIMDKTTMYPLSMYPESMQFILTYLIPVGWISFYPVSALLGIDSAYNAMLVPLITLVVGILVMIVAGVYFDIGLRKYESAGN